MHRFFLLSLAILLAAVMPACSAATASHLEIPDPALDEPLASVKSERSVVLAGGCFWGVEAVFEHVRGVTQARSGYAGGSATTASYEQVSGGDTGHAEVVEIIYDPSVISYGQLLKVFFAVAHDPTQLNRQGPDIGTEYRSGIFFSNEEQRRIAQAYIEQLNKVKVFGQPIVTEVTALKSFHVAEDYHQDFLVRHRNLPYIVIHDLPKIENLRKKFPDLFVTK